jgi:hypothetical protein
MGQRFNWNAEVSPDFMEIMQVHFIDVHVKLIGIMVESRRVPDLRRKWYVN